VKRGATGAWWLLASCAVAGLACEQKKAEPITYPWEEPGANETETSADEAPAVEPAVEPAPAEHQPAPETFVIQSTVVFAGLEDQPHTWRGVYQGSDLARWELALPSDPAGARQIEYQSKDAVFVLPSGSKTSRTVTGDEAQAVRARMALRRVVFTDDGAPLGPDPAWTDRQLDGALGTVRRETLVEGALRYHLLNEQAETLESLTVTRYRDQAGRMWPHTLTLAVGSDVIWNETVAEIQVQAWFNGDYFRPPDQKSALNR
jgi:hypothetical protein